MNKDRFKYRIYNENDKCYVKTPEKGYIPDAIVSPNGDIWDTDYGELFDTYTDGYIIEQCTGLRDKNGKLIYEGDFVKISYRDTTLHYCVQYDQANCQLYLSCGDSELSESFEVIDNWVIEIIGNIHETKESE